MTPIGQDEWVQLMDATEDWMVTGERRRSLRLPLHWTLYLACPGVAYPHRTETRNLSRDGFYCLLDEPLTAGEHVRCDIVVPTHAPNCDEVVMSLRCRAQVMRVEKIEHRDQYGLACRIEEYRLIHNPKPVECLSTVGGAESR